MRRASAPGADGVSWGAYRQGLRDRLARLGQRLRRGVWEPGPVREIAVTAYTGKVFTVVVPTVEDRIVHRAMRAAIEPILETRVLAEWVSGFRPARNRITALRQADTHVAAGRRWVADIDVAGASEEGTVDELVTWLAEHVTDGSFLALFRRALTGLPTPLIPGSGLWPVLFQLQLSRVDAQLAGLAVVRFAEAEMLTDPAAIHLLAGLQVPHGLRIRLRTRASAGGFTVIRADGRVWRNDKRALHIHGLRLLTTVADLALTSPDGSA